MKKEVEQLAEQLHNWYLEATKELNPENYNPKAQKLYLELNEQQKNIDRYIAKKIIDIFIKDRQKFIEILERIGKIIKVRLDYCQKQNGLPYCKNCGLSFEDLSEIEEIEKELKLMNKKTMKTREWEKAFMEKKEEINKSTSKEFFKDDKLEIGRILIEELTKWEDTKSPSSEEFNRLVNKLFNIIKQKSDQKIVKKCEPSPIYSKDNDDTLHFYCDFCGKEMSYNEVRECKAEREKCPRCGRELGESDYSVGVCLNCEYKLDD